MDNQRIQFNDSFAVFDPTYGLNFDPTYALNFGTNFDNELNSATKNPQNSYKLL